MKNNFSKPGWRKTISMNQSLGGIYVKKQICIDICDKVSFSTNYTYFTTTNIHFIKTYINIKIFDTFDRIVPWWDWRISPYIRSTSDIQQRKKKKSIRSERDLRFPLLHYFSSSVAPSDHILDLHNHHLSSLTPFHRPPAM